MMSDLQSAVQNLRQFGRTMKPIIDVANALEGIVSLDTLKGELEASVKALTLRSEDLKSAVSLAEAKVAEAAARALATTKAAEDSAEGALEAARKAADGVTDAARAVAREIEAAAQARADSLVKEAKAKIDADAEKAEQLSGDVASLQAEREILDGEIAMREERLATLKAQFASLAQ